MSSRIEPGKSSDTAGSPTRAEDVPNTPARPAEESSTRDISVENSPSGGFLSASPGRARVESVFVRVIATAGVIGVGTALGAALVANEVVGWVVGLVVSTVCVLCAAVLWRSRQL